MANLPLEERLHHYFLAMGAQRSTTESGSGSGLSFDVGKEKLHVAILKPADLAVRNRVIETVLSPSSRRTSELVYLAAPRLLGAAMDAAIFRSQGIGLLLFDDRRIDEAVPPQPVQRIEAPATITNNDSALATELTSLRAMYGEMERNLAQLREDMRNMRNNSQSAEPPLEKVRHPAVLSSEPVFTPPMPTPTVELGALPSYFNNNPWLDVLSKRGRPEN